MWLCSISFLGGGHWESSEHHNNAKQGAAWYGLLLLHEINSDHVMILFRGYNCSVLYILHMSAKQVYFG